MKSARTAPKVNPLEYRYLHGDPLPEKTVYLTFDDGPGEWTSRILDVLDRENVKATFFLCGRWGQPGKSRGSPSVFARHGAVLERMVDAGHVLGSHSSRHQDFALWSEKSILADLDENQADLDAVLGEKSPRLTLIRPPYGGPWFSRGSRKSRERITKVLQKRGLPMLWTWEGDSGDSADWTRGEWFESGDMYRPSTLVYSIKVQRIRKQVLSAADGQGIVVLMHDIHPTSADSLPEIIRELKARGYVFATLEDYVLGRWKMPSRQIVEDLNRPQPAKKPLPVRKK